MKTAVAVIFGPGTCWSVAQPWLCVIHQEEAHDPERPERVTAGRERTHLGDHDGDHDGDPDAADEPKQLADDPHAWKL
jgi:hypothetical protein